MLLRRIPAYLVNGIEVAIGVGLIHAAVAALAGAQAGLLASTGAICASLADLPTTVSRARQRVAFASILACAASAVVAALIGDPLALGVAIAVITFVALLTLGWGPRAMPISFAPILAIVFAVAAPAASAAQALAWTGTGAIAYLAWAVSATWMLQGFYRWNSLAEVMGATSRLLRSRARLVAAPRLQEADIATMRTWITDETALADRLQAARDLVFVAPDALGAARHAAILLRLIELREVLLASRLDLNLLGHDDAGAAARSRLGDGLRAIADALDAAQAAYRGKRASLDGRIEAPEFSRAMDGVSLPPDDPRARLLPALTDRLQRLAGETRAIMLLLRGDDAEPELPLSRQELRLFVAPDGWPLAAIRAQLTLRSPVLRHALRMSLAISAAFFIAHASPWSSHPAWVVLSVAVVLRGSLEQTLARRNARVLGTLLGCLLVLLLFQVPSTAVLAAVFIVSVAAAHAFVGVQYVVTAIAATVMALIQQHLAYPGASYAIVERIADTFLGAALAWAFSYVLPSWERRSLPQQVARAVDALRQYAALAMAGGEGPQAGAMVEQRLARRRAYDALAALAAAFQRSAAEPERVRLPLVELATLLDYGQRLMAHLSLIRLTLAHRSIRLEAPRVAAMLQGARAEIDARLVLDGRAHAAGDVRAAEMLGELPTAPPVEDRLAWLARRLRVTVVDGAEVGRAASELLARLPDARGGGRPTAA
ncbi:MAG TPA: FUSC family protein [Casimicrobiaceae bacterium]|nr:FUSC family protein [Casimicrobiaceae bacterium]